MANVYYTVPFSIYQKNLVKKDNLFWVNIPIVQVFGYTKKYEFTVNEGFRVCGEKEHVDFNYKEVYRNEYDEKCTLFTSDKYPNVRVVIIQ